MLYRHLERYEEGESHFQRSLGILNKAVGPEHPEVANTLLEYGNLLRKQGRYQEAESRYEGALKMAEKLLGLNAPLVAEILGDYEVSLTRQRRLEEAAQIQRRLAQIEATR